jgi:NAD(P)-dependent dehydrogenase (short-subunit alcohol dehydrogenase family)
LANGERVVATLRKPAALAALAEKHNKDQLLVLPLDVTNSKQIDEAFESVKKTFGRLDVVVNNAGHGLVGEVEGVEESAARALLDVLFWGAANVTKKVSPLPFIYYSSLTYVNRR